MEREGNHVKSLMSDNSQPIAFPDGPKLEFELLLTQLIERAQEVRSTQVRLRHLISANQSIVGDLDLSTMLSRIVETATQLVGAQYGAIGILNANGDLEEFIHFGMDADAANRIGNLPQGRGLLGALTEVPTPVRIKSIAADSRSSGFPPRHPPMESFLGVPIRVRGEVFGNLYLTNLRDGEFSADDEELALALAASAGIAIANARLFDDARYRERWSMVLAETTRRTMANEEDVALQLAVEGVGDLAAADLVCVMLVSPDRERLIVERAVGIGASELLAAKFNFSGSLVEKVLESGGPLVVDDIAARLDDEFTDLARLRQAMLVPFAVGNGEWGVLAAARIQTSSAFVSRDVDMASSFADQAGLAIQRAAARATERRMEILEDRGRIARDLHDHVIQKLFAAGLSLQAVASGLAPGTAADRVARQVIEIDDTIAQIRESIFELKIDPSKTRGVLRSRLLEIVSLTSANLDFKPKVRFYGPVDLMTDKGLADDAAAVVSESLTNVVRHAQALNVTLSVSAGDGELRVELTDDGVGLCDSPLRSGLDNLRDRAIERGGSFSVEHVIPHGTHVMWSAPV
ncbi:GAF domain-containing sensor histidine kinase [soil metagenome]